MCRCEFLEDLRHRDVALPRSGSQIDVDGAELVAGVKCMVGGQVSKMLTRAKQLAKLPGHHPHMSAVLGGNSLAYSLLRHSNQAVPTGRQWGRLWSPSAAIRRVPPRFTISKKAVSFAWRVSRQPARPNSFEWSTSGFVKSAPVR
jgi:hypothetical protein